MILSLHTCGLRPKLNHGKPWNEEHQRTLYDSKGLHSHVKSDIQQVIPGFATELEMSKQFGQLL